MALSIDPRRTLKSLILIYITFGLYFFYKKFYRKENLFFAQEDSEENFEHESFVESPEEEELSEEEEVSEVEEEEYQYAGETLKETFARHTPTLEEMLNPSKLRKKTKELRVQNKQMEKENRAIIKAQMAAGRASAKEEFKQNVEQMRVEASMAADQAIDDAIHHIKNPRLIWQKMKEANRRIEMEELEMKQYEEDEPSVFSSVFGAMRESWNSAGQGSRSGNSAQYGSQGTYNWICTGCWTTVISSKTPQNVGVPSELTGRHIHYFSKVAPVGPIEWRCSNCGAELSLKPNVHPDSVVLCGCTHKNRYDEILYDYSAHGVIHRWERLN